MRNGFGSALQITSRFSCLATGVPASPHSPPADHGLRSHDAIVYNCTLNKLRVHHASEVRRALVTTAS